MELNELKEHFYFCNDHFGTEIEYADGFFDKSSFYTAIGPVERNVHKRTGHTGCIRA